MIALPKCFALFFAMTLWKKISPKVDHSMNSREVSASRELLLSTGVITSTPNTTMTRSTIRPEINTLLLLFVFAHFIAAAATKPYRNVAIIVVTSTIQPIAERPIKGMNDEITAMKMIALAGTPFLFRTANLSEMIEFFPKPLSPNIPHKWLYRFCEKEGLPFHGLHSFRHFTGTQLIASGMDAKRTSMFLGHSQTSTTMNLYVHSVEQANESACDCLAKLLKTGLRP